MVEREEDITAIDDMKEANTREGKLYDDEGVLCSDSLMGNISMHIGS